MRPLRWLINAFIVVHLVAVTFWCVPYFPNTGGRWALETWNRDRDMVNRIFATYMRWSGLWQGWDMFAPEPLVVNQDVEADVTLSDGRSEHYIWPRMNELGLAERYQKERYRKWRERLPDETYKMIWPDAARWVARRFCNTASNPPVQVTLTQYTVTVPPPGAGYLPIIPFTERTQRHTYFTYVVAPADLTGP
jgi:hypothetical protein